MMMQYYIYKLPRLRQISLKPSTNKCICMLKYRHAVLHKESGAAHQQIVHVILEHVQACTASPHLHVEVRLRTTCRAVYVEVSIRHAVLFCWIVSFRAVAARCAEL